jgi:hypothetical protein
MGDLMLYHQSQHHTSLHSFYFSPHCSQPHVWAMLQSEELDVDVV